MLRYCILSTQCSLLFLDSERAAKLESRIHSLQQDGVRATFVLSRDEGKGNRDGMAQWDLVFETYDGDTKKVLDDPNSTEISPEDNATIFFTSGTTGKPSTDGVDITY